MTDISDTCRVVHTNLTSTYLLHYLDTVNCNNKVKPANAITSNMESSVLQVHRFLVMS